MPEPSPTPLILRRVTGHPQAQNAFRVVYNGREIGSLGLTMLTSDKAVWRWGLDTILPRQPFPTRGDVPSKEAAMIAFRQMWSEFSADEGRLKEFLAGYRD